MAFKPVPPHASEARSPPAERGTALSPVFQALSMSVSPPPIEAAPAAAADPAADPAPAAATSGFSGGSAAPPPPTYESMDEYVRAMGGKRAIKKILVANNGIAAVKAIRSIRRWAFEMLNNDRAITFVAMASPEDLKANAEYIHLADEFVRVPGGANHNNYANVSLITEVAQRTGADACWAGWGHASENPKLPEALSRVGVTWIGPGPAAMRALGDKIGSTLIAQSASVPCVGWSGSGLEVDYARTGIPSDVYQRACVRTAEESLEVASRIGFPVMIKASEGGGGKGIRKVERAEQVRMAFEQVRGEVPGSPIFLMRLAPVARHLEVQLLADEWGDAIAVFGRDCSIQRRHQKIIEEGPVVAAPPDVWREMERAAVRLAREVGYVGAGTVEYLYTPDNKYYFLELNPRLQVEHPVSELISGVNLPAAQVQVAMGIPLHRMSGVRRMYREPRWGDSRIDFDAAVAVPMPGHVIACRITAENPDLSFQPTSGVIQELNFRSTPDVWGYFSVSSQSSVHEFSDSQFGHLFAFGETREHARRNMVVALRELSIRGDIRTTVEYLPKVLETEDFKANRVDTTWLERVMAMHTVQTEKPPTAEVVLLGAIFRAHTTSTASLNEYMLALERGQMPSVALHNGLVSAGAELIYEGRKYACAVSRSGPSSFDVSLNGQIVSADVHMLADGGLLVLLGGKKHVVYGREFPNGLRLVVDGKTCLFSEEYDPTQLRSAVAGKLVRFVVDDGAHVEKGQAYAEMEVMKMYVTLAAPEAGVITCARPEGSVLETGDLIAQLELDDPSTVERAEVFRGTFPAFGTPQHIGDKPNLQAEESLRKLRMLLDGYKLGAGVAERALDTLMRCLRNPRLPLHQLDDMLAALAGRLPEELAEELAAVARDYADALSADRFYWESPVTFPADELLQVIERHEDAAPGEAERDAISRSLEPVVALLRRYGSGGNHLYAVSVLLDLLDSYMRVEELFNPVEEPGSSAATRASAVVGQRRAESVIRELRQRHKDDLAAVMKIALAHHQTALRNRLVVSVLGMIQTQLRPLLCEFEPMLARVCALRDQAHAEVALRARQLLMLEASPSPAARAQELQTLLNSSVLAATQEERVARLAPLIEQSTPIEDVIFDFFSAANPAVRAAALEAYVRRVYQVFTITAVTVTIGDGRKAVGGAGGTGAAGATGAAAAAAAAAAVPPRAGDAGKAAAADGQSGGSRRGRWFSWAGFGNSGKEAAGTVAGGGASRLLPPRVPSSSGAGGRAGAAMLKARWEFHMEVEQVSDADAAHEKAAPPPGLRAVDSVANLGRMADAVGSDLASPWPPPASTSPSQKKQQQKQPQPQQQHPRRQPTPSPTGGAASGRFYTVRQPASMHVVPAESVSFASAVSVVRRVGVMAHCASLDQLSGSFESVLADFPVAAAASEEPVNVLYVSIKAGGALRAGGAAESDQKQHSAALAAFLAAAGRGDMLKAHGVRRVTFVVMATAQRRRAASAANVRDAAAAEAAASSAARGGAGAGRRSEDDAAGGSGFPAYYTFRHRHNYAEDPIVRNVEPTYALHMELARLSNFKLRFVPTANRMIHLFEAHPLRTTDTGAGSDSVFKRSRRPDAYDGRRLFARVIVRSVDSHMPVVASALSRGGPNGGEEEPELDAHPETEFAFVEALTAIELAMGADPRRWHNNSIFINVLIEAVLTPRYIERQIRALARRYAEKSMHLNVSLVEFAVSLRLTPDATESTPIRFVCENATGAALSVRTYTLAREEATGRVVFLDTALRGGADGDGAADPAAARAPGPWHKRPVSQPYSVSVPFGTHRIAARTLGTTYVYDLPTLFGRALDASWRAAAAAGAAPPPAGASLHDWRELVLAVDDQRAAAHGGVEAAATGSLPDDCYLLRETRREPGRNVIGMVAWVVTLRTPECPGGREAVVIANDITHQAGTFGVQEDMLFGLASRYARERGLPRVYVSANSGARIGLAHEVQGRVRAAWHTPGDPSKGFEYLYLSAADAAELADSVRTRVVQADGEERHVLTDVVGRQHGLGVENLRGSGTIAGETSQAYDETFTLTYITGRSVGIGAYLARLGHRCIQKDESPLLLTGYNALNKLLGRRVYTSNVQLGGLDVMYTNGIAHLRVADDMAGVAGILRWLSYVPASRRAPGPVLLGGADPVARPVLCRPLPGVAYDPVHLVAGRAADEDPAAAAAGGGGGDGGGWLHGLFDRGSWMEVMGGWARTVVTGRARLGGIPVGVVAVETRTVEDVRMADPAVPESKEVTVMRAGQVWYPDSAFKTAQAIRDMQAEDLPLFVLANWRGFSGGQQDMLDSVLKFGSYIVDHLRSYERPVFVYIPPHGTLRGGAWVVVDPTINARYMEMYADPDSRGGVLEAAGTVDVKIRRSHMLADAHRLDPELARLDAELERLEKLREAGDDAEGVARRIQDAMTAVDRRERLVLPVFHQMATSFCDLHDTPGRMEAKRVVHGVVPWEGAREFFYWRLRRRLVECDFVDRIEPLLEPRSADAPAGDAADGPAWRRAVALLRDAVGSDEVWRSDRGVAEWAAASADRISAAIEDARAAHAAREVRRMAAAGGNAFARGLAAAVGELSDAQLNTLRDALKTVRRV